MLIPVLYLLVGSLMGKGELKELLASGTWSDKGLCGGKTAAGISDYGILCGTSFGYTGVFCDVLEFSENDFGNSGRTAIDSCAWQPGGWQSFGFPGEIFVYVVHCIDDDAVSSIDAVKLSGIRRAVAFGFTGGDYFPSGVFDFSSLS